MTCLLLPDTAETEVAVQSRPALSGRKVILHKDDYHQTRYVVVALTRVVASLEEEVATGIATTAWTDGTAVVIVCPSELAEHYQEQLCGYGLKVTVE